VDSAESELDAESELESEAVVENETVVENPEKIVEENVEEIVEEKQDPAPLVKNTQATSTGYVPASWSVPDTKPAKKDRDDLTAIKGVGPVLEKVLHDTGIYYFRQMALLDKDGIDELQEQIPQFPGRIRRDQWVKQAKKLHQKKHGAAAT